MISLVKKLALKNLDNGDNVSFLWSTSKISRVLGLSPYQINQIINDELSKNL